jgi:uncharacterized membrane protein (DUF4010 family)
MNTRVKKWIKPAVILMAFFLVAWFLPSEPIDPWGLFSLKRAAYMVFALAFIEAFGSAMILLLGNRKGAIMTGSFGGLVSSTATTVALARESQVAPIEDLGKQTLTFLAATLAMLLEGAALLLLGTSEIHPSLLLIFLGPALVTALMVVYLARKLPHRKVKAKDTEPEIEILPILKLSAFILAVLAISLLLQNVFGQSGLLVLTLLVSLFEVHGSIIANIQLHDAGVFGIKFLGGLFALSASASFISKLFLIYTLGSKQLRSKAIKYSAAMAVSLAVSWVIFQFVIPV